MRSMDWDSNSSLGQAVPLVFVVVPLVDGKTVRAERSRDLVGNPILRIKVAVEPGETHSVKAK